MSGNGKGENMLIEKVVFNFNEVGEKSLMDIKNECMVSFAYKLKEALTSNEEKIRKFWSESSIANYKVFQDLFGSKIKYNSKNIVLEEVVYNNDRSLWNLKQTCADVYGLEYVEGTAETSDYFRYKKSKGKLTCDTCCAESVGTEREAADECLRNFYKSFGLGEFPFMTITIIRLGNKDHYFYDIHR